MHRTIRLLVGAVLVMSSAACKKDSKKEAGGGEGSGGSGTGGSAAVEKGGGAGFEALPIEFVWRTWTDSREMKFAIQAQIPKGWKLMTEGENVKMLQTFMPGDTDPKGASLYSTSSLTYSATCHGSCMAKDIPEQVKKVAASRAGTGGKILQDGELSPGVHGYVIEMETYEKDKKQYNVGVTHYNAEWDSVVFCESMLQGAEAKRYKEFLDACAATKFDVIDVAVGADRMKQEEANLAKCPAASTLTYTAKQPKPDDPVFDGVKAIQATSSQVGSVGLQLASVPLTGDEWRDKALEPGQGVVEIWLGLAQGGPPDVLSGVYLNESTSLTTASVSVKVTGGVSYSVASGGKTSVEVIARTRKKICGKIDVEDEFRAIKGEFVADFEVRD